MIVAESKSLTRSFPTLASLGLGNEQLVALARQGSLRAEDSTQGRRIFKLRFRVKTKQVVRYIGCNLKFVEQIQRELMELQIPEKDRRQRERLIHRANACLRKTKHQLMPLLPLAGRYFYGREPRRRLGHHDPGVDCNEVLHGTLLRSEIMDDRHERGERSVTENLTQKNDTVNGVRTADRRRQRLDDLYAVACEIPDPLRAGIRSATADLLEIGCLLGSAIKRSLGAGGTDLRQVQDVMPAVNTLALVHKQTTRFVQVDLDWASENDQGSAT